MTPTAQIFHPCRSTGQPAPEAEKVLRGAGKKILPVRPGGTMGPIHPLSVSAAGQLDTLASSSSLLLATDPVVNVESREDWSLESKSSNLKTMKSSLEEFSEQTLDRDSESLSRVRVTVRVRGSEPIPSRRSVTGTSSGTAQQTVIGPP